METNTELTLLIEKVSVEKRNEVQTVLNRVFTGVAKMREQLDLVIVADENDKINMKLANTMRLGVRKIRLEAEEIFEAKRKKVQYQMLSYQTEDKLWLKANQTMQILTKEIETIARYKEETRERFDAEQKELNIQKRIIKISKFAPEISRFEFENMSEEMFNLFYEGIENKYNAKIENERKAEEERIAKEKAEAKKNERLNKMLTLGLKWDGEQFTFKDINFHWSDLVCYSDAEFEKAFEGVKKRKEQIELEEKAENERLKLEAEAKEKQLAEERAKAEEERKAIEDKARKEREEMEIKLAKEKEIADAKLKEQKEETEKLQAQIKLKTDAEMKAKKEALAKAETELKAKELAEKEAKSAPDRFKLNDFAHHLDNLILPDLKSPEAQKIITDAKILLTKVSKFIREKTELI